MKRRLLSLLLALCLCVSLVPVVAPRAQALSLQQLQAKFPSGAYWNHYVNSTYDAADYLKQVYNESYADTITYNRCASHSNSNLSYYVGKYDCNYFDGGIQCCGFARKLAYDAYGTRASGWSQHYDIYSVKPGDVVHYKAADTDSTYGHWVFVTAVSGTTITVGECNIGSDFCKIQWGRTMNLANTTSRTIYSAPYALSTTTESVDVGDDFYARIKSVSSGKYLTDSADNVVISSPSGLADQLWYFDRQSDGSYVISAGFTGKVLDVSGASAVQGTNVQTYTYWENPAQKWYLTGDANSYYFHAQCTGCVMDVYNNETADGTNVLMWGPSGNANQKFTIEKVSVQSNTPVVTSDRAAYAIGSQVTVSWPAVPGTTHYWIDVWTADNQHPISERVSGTSCSFTPTLTGDYRVYITAAFPTGSTLSQPCSFAVKEPGELFTDVPADSYYNSAVQWAVKNGITQGTSTTTFGPDEFCTRAQVVAFLWRSAGSPEPAGSTNPFTDVKPTDYFYKAVLWAVENKITVGTSDTTFSPGDTCTRAQVATFLWRVKGSPVPSDLTSPFRDVPLNQYYYIPVIWAVRNGITQGDGGADTFNPNGKCTRAQIVTFLYRASN